MTVSGSPPRSPPDPSRQDKGKATTITSGEDQPDRSSTEPPPGIKPSEGGETNAVPVMMLFNPPRPRTLPKEAMCFTMTVRLIELVEPHMKLRLSREDAFHLTDNPELLKEPPVLFSKELLVLDEFNKLYNMNISNHNSGSLTRFHVNTEWHEFALSKNLKEGHHLMFYRFLDDATGQLYYRLDVFKIPLPLPGDRRLSESEPEPKPEPDHSYDPGDDENCCLSRTLSASEVAGGVLDPILLLDPQEAYDLTDNIDFLADHVITPKTLRVYQNNEVYVLRLSAFAPNNNFVGYSISKEWAGLVADNNLEVGDRVFFLKYPPEEDEGESDNYDYKFKFTRKNPKLAEVKAYKCPDRVKRPDPGSRSLGDRNHCFSMALKAFEGLHDGGKPRLFMHADVASKFFNCPSIEKKYNRDRKLRENLVVFDEADMQYDMLFSNFKPDFGEMIFIVDAGWQRFVKIHNLTAGDVVHFYRIMDVKVHDKPYYVVRSYRNNIQRGSVAGPSGSTGVGPSGSTGAGPSGSGAGPSGTAH